MDELMYSGRTFPIVHYVGSLSQALFGVTEAILRPISTSVKAFSSLNLTLLYASLAATI